ncbi:MAG: His/Gly/Thr/Pro-type tRNA ligase C-terminal domain-containing protein, partial [Candidatus Aenigmatarchaeota archaeon]
VNIKKVLEIVEKIRSNEINTYLPFEPYKNILEGIKDLSSRGIKYAIIFGKEEEKENKLTLQNLETREKIRASLEEVLEYLKR